MPRAISGNYYLGAPGQIRRRAWAAGQPAPLPLALRSSRVSPVWIHDGVAQVHVSVYVSVPFFVGDGLVHDDMVRIRARLDHGSGGVSGRG